MSKLLTYREKEQLMQQLAQELAKLEEDPVLKKELEFKEDIQAVLTKYDKQPNDLSIIFGLQPEKGKGRGNFSPRPTLVFVNPHTNEVVKTKGGNQKTLREWRKQYGRETVASWQQNNFNYSLLGACCTAYHKRFK